MKSRSIIIIFLAVIGGIVISFVILLWSGKLVPVTSYLIDGVKRIRYARERTLDAQRVRDLQAIRKAITQYFTETGKRPTNLDELSQMGAGAPPSTTDPETRQTYEYQVDLRSYSDGRAYDLCANFRAPSPLIKIDETPPCPSGSLCTLELRLKIINPIAPDEIGGFWEHPIGRQCWVFFFKGAKLPAGF